MFLTLLSHAVHAQADAHVGITAAGGVSVYGGRASVEFDATGYEAGATADLGWIRTQRFRLQADLALLRATLTETVEVEGRTYRDHFFDLTASVSLVVLAGGDGWPVRPYALAGAGVHALSSAFGSLTIDRRYNANPFGSHAAAGLRTWIGASGRAGAFLEARVAVAEHVNRTTIRAGGTVYLNDLVRQSDRQR
jgi:hypothetical protein